MTKTKEPSDPNTSILDLSPVNGLRTWACFTIVFFHSAYYSTIFFSEKHHLFAMGSFRFVVLLAVWVDLFFLLSGFFLGRKILSWTRTKDQTHDSIVKRWIYHSIDRWFRFLPGAAIGSVFCMIVGEPFGTARWWHDLLLLQWFPPFWSKGSEFIRNIWSTGVDLVTHIFLVPIFYTFFSKVKSFSFRMLFVLLGVIATTWWRFHVFDPVLGNPFASDTDIYPAWTSDWYRTYMKDTYDINIIATKTNMVNYVSFMDRLYFDPRSRAAPFIIGIGFALLIQKQYSSNPIRINPVVNKVFRGFMFVYCTAIMFSPIFLDPLDRPEPELSKPMTGLYHVLYDVIFAYITYCVICPLDSIHSIPTLRKFLSHRFFKFFAPVSYVFYVIHYRIIILFIGSRHMSPDSTIPSYAFYVISLFVAVVIFTFLLAYPLFKFLENPASSFLRTTLKKFFNPSPQKVKGE